MEYHKFNKIIHIKYGLMLLLTIGVITSSQVIEIQKITTQQGYIIMQVGEQPIIQEYNELTYTLNKTDILKTFIFLKETINKIDYLNTKLIKKHIIEIESEVRIFELNKKRTKRGLINAIGKGFKYLFGTLDDDDQLRINERLEYLEDTVLTNDNAESLIKHINEEIINLNNLNKISNILMDRITKFTAIDSLFNAVLEFHEYIKEIQLSITLAKIGVFNPKLFDIESFEHINTNQLEFIKLSLWQKNELLIFILSLPVYSDLKPIYEIITIPNEQYEELDFNYIHDPFIKENNELMASKNGKLIPINDECLKNIMNNNETKCNYRINTLEEIVRLNENSLIIKNIKKQELTNNCGSFKLNIESNNLI